MAEKKKPVEEMTPEECEAWETGEWQDWLVSVCPPRLWDVIAMEACEDVEVFCQLGLDIRAIHTTARASLEARIAELEEKLRVFEKVCGAAKEAGDMMGALSRDMANASDGLDEVLAAAAMCEAEEKKDE